jgi:hypothetical protein
MREPEIDRLLARATIAVPLLLALGAVTPAPVAAEEVRQRLNTPMILEMLQRPVEAPEAAFNAAVKRDASTPRVKRADEPEILADGSMRYGRGGNSVTVTIRNPCPPGDLEHEAQYYARPLPGRRK